MRTQWQFGPGDGNIPARTLMGNPHGGDAWQFAGKSNRTSSRKIYSACRHCLLSISGVALLRKNRGAEPFAICDRFEKRTEESYRFGVNRKQAKEKAAAKAVRCQRPLGRDDHGGQLCAVGGHVVYLE